MSPRHNYACTRVPAHALHATPNTPPANTLRGPRPFKDCKAMENLGVGVNDVNAARVAEAGGIEVAIATMKRFPGDAQLQRSCMWVLTNIAANSSYDSAVAAAGGVTAVAAALKRWPKEPQVQWNGALALISLVQADRSSAAHPQSKARSLSAGSISELWPVLWARALLLGERVERLLSPCI